MNKKINIIATEHKNFGLPPQEFDLLCSKLRNGDNSLFERIYLKHFKKCQKFLQSNYRLNDSQSYDITMDTLIHFRKNLISGKIAYGNLEFLFTRMAYFLMIKKHKEKGKLDKEEFKHIISLQEDSLEKERRLNKIESAMEKLNNTKRRFLEEHYGKKLKLTEIAKKYGESDATIRKRKQRILIELKKLLKA